ncbi:LacI family DNA-binding transcriptional regulator [Belnapia rosea]|uniref:LacI family DNA-binding transcriptional regulator n=1 Tax=Belnapia rosea TaxID=938405 RepID=UPI00088077B7|nr:substrate-binding domain-containing protein [Belnapia rosea]SDB74651.1 transcriptional regulator, LacI family [Belnapia rosea]
MTRQRAVTIKDVAREAGVGLGTVSRVINHHPQVAEVLRAKVEEAIRDLGYAPDIAAQSLRGRKTRSFACVFRDLTVPVLAAFVDAMQQELGSEEYAIFVASSYHDLAHERALLANFAARRVDGLVIASSSESDQRLLRLISRAPMPVVLLDRAAPAGLDVVRADHASGTQQAIDNLLRLGHRRIAMVSGEPSVGATRERLRGFSNAHTAFGLQPDPDLLRFGSFAIQFGFDQAEALLAAPRPPTAFFVAGAALLPGVLRALRARGLRIPEDVSVVAGADSELAEFHQPPISVVRWNHGALGTAAARFLLRRLQTPGLPPQEHVTPTEFLPRGSFAPPAK